MIALRCRPIRAPAVPASFRHSLFLFTLLAGPLCAENLALQISSETAPAGGWAQIKISSATPQLVAAGRISMHFDPSFFGDVAGVAVFSAEGDVMGIASVSGRSLDVMFSSAAGGIGQLPYLPILTVTVRVLASAPAGTSSSVTLDPNPSSDLLHPTPSSFGDGKGNTYSVTVTPGSVTVGGSLSVRNLAPGGGLLPAGALVRINGTGFSAATAVSIEGVSLSTVQFVDTGEIDLNLGGAADLTGKRCVVRNPDGSQVVYFSAIPSTTDQPPNSTAIEPLLSMQTWTSAETRFTDRGGMIALQNPNSTPVDVILQTRSAVSLLAGQTSVTIPPGALNVYSTRDSGGGDGFRAFASLPLRMLGMFFNVRGGVGLSAVSPALPPVQQLRASPAAVSFHWQVGTAVPAPVSISLDAMSFPPNFTFRVTSPVAPFFVTPTQETPPAALKVAVNPVGLSTGTYSGYIILTPEGPNATVTTIPLSLTVSGAALLVPNPQSLTFLGPDNYSQGLNVESNGNPASFTAAASNGAGPQWLTVSLSGGTTPARLVVNANSTNLSEGSYSGQIVITGPNNTVIVPVQLSVSVSNIFTFSPSSVTFSTETGSVPPPPQTVLFNGARPAFSASTTSGGTWLSVSPTGGGAVITVNPTSLAAGTYTGTVKLTSPASSLPASFPVTLVVWDKEPKLTVTPPRVTFTTPLPTDSTPLPPLALQVSSGGVPLNFAVEGRPGVFTTPASIPAYVENRGALGTYEYDITITGGSQKVVVPVKTVVTTSALAPPFIGSVVNAASQVAGSVAPGEILTIYGFGAGPSDGAGFTLDESGKVATSLNGAQVLFDGRPAPMIYGSASQANVIVPYEVANQATTVIALRYGDVTSPAWAIPVAASVPGIFTLDSSGIGAGAVLNQDDSVNGASNPAPRGSVIQIYATGEGQETSDLPVKVTIGGQDVVVRYAGPGGDSVVGLFQVNAVVPPAVAPDSAVSIIVTVGGIPSQSGVTIAVQYRRTGSPDWIAVS